jgi:phage terminase small subunit
MEIVNDQDTTALPAPTTPAKPKLPALRLRHRKFLAEYLRTGNATESAIRAGYSPRTAAVQGSRLLRTKLAPFVADALRAEHVTPDEVLTLLSRQARANYGYFINDDGTVNVARVKESGHLVEHYSRGTEKIPEKLRLTDRQRATELLAKIHGLFDDQAPGPKISIAIQINGNPASI